jgi:hypothetical protein
MSGHPINLTVFVFELKQLQTFIETLQYLAVLILVRDQLT